VKTRIGQPVVIEHVAAEAAQTIKEGKMQLGLIGPGRMSITMASGHIDYLGDVCPATLPGIAERAAGPVILGALFSRFKARENTDYAGRVLSARRKRFGMHEEKKGEA
jgi:6-phosphogluconate dehydrogenase (decarboxylating)